MCRSTIALRISDGIDSMNDCPDRMRPMLASSKTFSTPGRPTEAPLTTTGSPVAGGCPDAD